MKVYLFLDEEGYCTGWGSNEEVNSVPYELNNEVILNGIMKYRYYEGVLVYDETKALINAKEARLYNAKKQLGRLIEKGFEVTLEGELFIFPYNDENKQYLNKAYELTMRDLITNVSLRFLKNGEEVVRVVDKVNVYELWLLSFLHEESCQKHYEEYIDKINEVKTLKEIQKIKFSEEEEING